MNNFLERFPDIESINRKIPEYQDLYYDHYKPIMYSVSDKLIGYSKNEVDEIDRLFAPVLETFGWTMEDFKAFADIDLMQRIGKVKMKEDLEGRDHKRIKVSGVQDVFQFSLIDEIKCPRRTEEGKFEFIEVESDKPGFKSFKMVRKDESPE